MKNIFKAKKNIRLAQNMLNELVSTIHKVNNILDDCLGDCEGAVYDDVQTMVALQENRQALKECEQSLANSGMVNAAWEIDRKIRVAQEVQGE